VGTPLDVLHELATGPHDLPSPSLLDPVPPLPADRFWPRAPTPPPSED
jgi:hypothetical protein